MKYCYKLHLMLLVMVLISAPIILSAQEAAVTKSGKEVYLKSDLEELSQEKRAAIKSQPAHFIVVNDKQELNSLDLIDEGSKGSFKAHEGSVPADDEVAKKVEELEEKVERGEMSKEEAKAIYNKKYKSAFEDNARGSDISGEENLSLEEKAYRTVVGDRSRDEEMTKEEKRQIASEVRKMERKMIEEKRKEQKQLEEKISRYTEKGYTRDEAIELVKTKKTSTDK